MRVAIGSLVFVLCVVGTNSFRPMQIRCRLPNKPLRSTEEDKDGSVNTQDPIVPASPAALGTTTKETQSEEDKKSYYFFNDDRSGGKESVVGYVDIKRFVTYNALALVLALGANFCGITSAIMSNTEPALFRAMKFDQLYSVDGFRRAVPPDNRYEFIFPENWLADQTIAMAKVRDSEIPQNIRRAKTPLIRPDMAFGPAKSDGRENVSVIKSKVLPGFTLEGTLGTPTEAAERLLSTVIAPPQSGKSYELIGARSDTRKGGLAYTLEYIVRKGETLNQHSVSVVMYLNQDLYTLTAMVPEGKWAKDGQKIQTIAKSFDINPELAPPVPF